MEYQTISADRKRQLLQQRLEEIELRHFETQLNLAGCEAAPVKSPQIVIDIGNLRDDLQNLDALLALVKSEIDALPLETES